MFWDPLGTAGNKLNILLYVLRSSSGKVSASASYATCRNPSTVQVPGLDSCARFPYLRSGFPAAFFSNLDPPTPSKAAKHLKPTDWSSRVQEVALRPKEVEISIWVERYHKNHDRKKYSVYYLQIDTWNNTSPGILENSTFKQKHRRGRMESWSCLLMFQNCSRKVGSSLDVVNWLKQVFLAPYMGIN